MAYRILIVDDSKIVRSMIKKGITMSGAEVDLVCEASNGIEALHTLSDQVIDIVFTDLHMPEMDGMELIQKMSESDRLGVIPIVVVSSDRCEARIEELKKRGIRAYMTKPFLPENFREVFRVLLGASA